MTLQLDFKQFRERLLFFYSEVLDKKLIFFLALSPSLSFSVSPSLYLSQSQPLSHSLSFLSKLKKEMLLIVIAAFSQPTTTKKHVWLVVVVAAALL